MAQKCCIYLCESRSEGEKEGNSSNVTFHSFPANLDARMNWMKIISCKRAWTPPVKDIESLLVCSDHFTTKDYIIKAGKWTLRAKAVPSKFRSVITPTPVVRVEISKSGSKRLAATPLSSPIANKKGCTGELAADPQVTGVTVNASLSIPEVSASTSKQVADVGAAVPSTSKSPVVLNRVVTTIPQPDPSTLKHIVFTDKSGHKLLLLTAPMPTKPALPIKPTSPTKPTSPPSKPTNVEAAETTYAEVEAPPSPSTEQMEVNLATTSSLALEKTKEPKAKSSPPASLPTQTKKPAWSLKANITTKEVNPPPSNLRERMVELKILQEMALMKRELLKKTLQLTQMRNLVEKLKKERAIGSVKKANALMKSVRVLQEKADNGEQAAIFLMDQIAAIDRGPRYSDSTIQYCARWRNVSVEGYEFVRRENFISLPSLTTITKSISQKDADVAVGTISKNGDLQKRLQKQLTKLTEVQKVGSLVIQGISTSSLEAAKSVKELMKAETDEALMPSLMTTCGHYMTYQFIGLDLPEPISLGRHYTKNVTDTDTLKSLTVQMCADAEKVGLKVMRIIGDASLDSLAMFGLMGENCGPAINPQVMNPVSPTRPLYLTCDFVDVIRRLRAQFVEEDNKLINAGRSISRSFVRRLYNMKATELDVALAQLPPRKSTLTKLGRFSRLPVVINIFSPVVTKTMRLKMEDNDGLKNADTTIEFLEMMYSWCVVQDICNSSPEVVPEGLSIEDKFLHAALLEWLEDDFLSYLENWRQSCTDPNKQFLSSTNYGTLRLTTLASVLYVRYLLESKFHLTNPKNFDEQIVNSVVSDIIEKKKSRHLDPETITLVSGEEDPQPETVVIHQYEENMAASLLQEVSMPDGCFQDAAYLVSSSANTQ